MTNAAKEDLPTTLKEQIVGIGQVGYVALEAGDFAKARRLFLDAFGLLPEPRYEWAVGEPLLADAAYSAILEGDDQRWRLHLPPRDAVVRLISRPNKPACLSRLRSAL
jgi:hypothetical protein